MSLNEGGDEGAIFEELHADYVVDQPVAPPQGFRSKSFEVVGAEALKPTPLFSGSDIRRVEREMIRQGKCPDEIRIVVQGLVVQGLVRNVVSQISSAPLKEEGK